MHISLSLQIGNVEVGWEKMATNRKEDSMCQEVLVDVYDSYVSQFTRCTINQWCENISSFHTDDYSRLERLEQLFYVSHVFWHWRME